MKAKNYIILALVCSTCAFPFTPFTLAEGRGQQVEKTISNNNHNLGEIVPQNIIRSDSREVLTDLQGVIVVVEMFRSEVRKYGFNEQTYRNLVELRLRQYGIKVIPATQQLQTTGYPYLYININPGMIEEKGFAVSIDVQLKETVHLLRNSTILVTGATTWQTGTMSFAGMERLNEIGNSLRKLIDNFINDYLAANPNISKDTSSKKGFIKGTSNSEGGQLSALIDSQFVHEGDTIGDIKVIKINKDSVEFEKDGLRWTQGIGKSPGPQWQ